MSLNVAQTFHFLRRISFVFIPILQACIFQETLYVLQGVSKLRAKLAKIFSYPKKCNSLWCILVLKLFGILPFSGYTRKNSSG